MSTNVLLHLHPQGAFVARAIDYCEERAKKAVIYPCFYPSFMDGYNKEFARQLEQDIKDRRQVKETELDIKFMRDKERWSINKRVSHDVVEKPRIYEEVKSASIIDTLSRNLLTPSVEYFNGNRSYKSTLESKLANWHDNIYYSFVDLILRSNSKLIILSHINYIFYTAPLLAAQATGIETLLLHGGYNETILIKQRQSGTYSSARLRKEVFNACSSQAIRQYGKDKRKHEKVFENAESIVDTATILKQTQNKHKIIKDNRLLILNHQIISEIAYKFPDYAWSKKTSNRFELLEYVIRLIDEKTKGNLIIRIHPDAVRYPGEIELTKNLINSIETQNIKVSIHQSNQAHLIGKLVEECQLYPEILTLGGNATCELIGKGIKAISVTECYMPKSCKRFELRGPHELAEYIEKPDEINGSKIKDEEIEDCKNFINLFKRAGLRLSENCNALNRSDKYFHFNNREEAYDLSRFIEECVNLKIIKNAQELINEECDTHVFINKLREEVV